MAEITLRDVEKYFGDNYVIRKLNLDDRGPRVRRPARPLGLRQDHDAARHRRPRGDRHRRHPDRRQAGAALPPGERDIAFVFQLFALYPHLTAFENIAFPLRATGESRADDRAARCATVARVAADRAAARQAARRSSSGGDMQRVAIGRALVRRPKALLMDEPIGALDAKLREDMRAELKRLHIENGTTTVYVTHDQIEAMALADRVAVMNDGVLQQVGTPSEVYLHPANLFVAQFVGRPVMNILPATVATERRPHRRSRSATATALRLPGELPRPARGAAAGPRAHARHPARGRTARARGSAGLRARDGGAHHRAARRLRHRRPHARRQLPQGAHRRAASSRARRRHGLGASSTRRRSISSTPPPASRCGVEARAWLRSDSKASPSASAPYAAVERPDARHRRRRVLRPARPDRRRQDHDAPPDRRPRDPRRRRGSASAARTPADWSVAAARRGARLPVLLALSALHRAPEPRLPAEVAGAQRPRAPRSSARIATRRQDAAHRATCSSARPTGSPAARCSASRSAGPSCATRASS